MLRIATIARLLIDVDLILGDAKLLYRLQSGKGYIQTGRFWSLDEYSVFLSEFINLQSSIRPVAWNNCLDFSETVFFCYHLHANG